MTTTFWNRKKHEGLVTLSCPEDVRHFKVGMRLLHGKAGPIRVRHVDYQAGTITIDSPWWMRARYRFFMSLADFISWLSKVVGQ